MALLGSHRQVRAIYSGPLVGEFGEVALDAAGGDAKGFFVELQAGYFS